MGFAQSLPNGPNMLKTSVSIQTILLAAIGLADLISTIVLLQLGLAEEANPLMRALLPFGWPVFVTVKCATLVAYFYTITWYRQRHPRKASFIENAALASYLFVYITLFTTINF